MGFCFVFETGSHIAQAGLKLVLAEVDLQLLFLLPPPPKCWDYRPATFRSAEKILIHRSNCLDFRKRNTKQ